MIRLSRLGFVCIVALLTAHCSVFSPSSNRRTELVFGTPCTITFYERVSTDVIDKVFEEMHRIDAMMSPHLRSSDVFRINESSGRSPVSVPSDLYRVVQAGLAFSQVSGGAFDITIGPLVDLWDIAGEDPRVPSRDAIETALEFVDYLDVVTLDYEHQILLKRRGMSIDLGAIAKGFASDRAAEMLAERGIERAIIDFGGNIYALGRKEEDQRWRIGIQDPFEPRGNFLGVVEISDRSVVTSGTYERFFVENGIRYHHILDPDFGFPAETGLASVSIIAQSSMTADALSTAVFVLGENQGLALIDAYDGVEAILITDDRRVILSEGAEDLFSLADGSYSIETPEYRR